MTNELTPLEELQFIRQFEINDDHRTLNDHVICRQSLDNIETALKDYEMEHTLRVRLENINYELVREKQANEKKLKALEIIKEKQIDVYHIKNLIEFGLSSKDAVDIYNKNKDIVFQITEEGFDLLKEVLK